MGEKRFRCAVGEDIIRHMPYVVVEYNKNLYKIDKVVDLLNELAEENVFLRFEVSHLQKENEEAKGVEKDAFKLLKENTLLLCKIHKIKEIVEETDYFTDEAIEHDIIAYREMQSFDNKDAYEIASAFKKIMEILE